VQLGPAALDLIPANTPRTTAETKERLGRVRRQLENLVAEANAQPSLVTLEGEMKLSEAIAAITKQTGNKIFDYRSEFGQQETDPTVKVSFKETPFWEALDKLFDEARMTIYDYSGRERSLARVARAVDSELPRFGRAGYAGRFRIEGQSITAQRDLKNPANQSLELMLELSWEPSIQPIVVIQPLDQIVAISDTGKPLEIAGTDGTREITSPGEISAAEFEIDLHLPARDVQKIASLKGRMTAIIPGKVETFEFPNITEAKNVVQRRAGVAVVLEEVRKNNDVYDVRMRVEYDKAANALESHRLWVYDNPAMLLSPDGDEVSHDGFEDTRRDSNVMGIAYHFVLEEEPKGYKFVYKTPASIMKVPLEYELKNIDLP
jgi:hypothetical protein